MLRPSSLNPTYINFVLGLISLTVTLVGRLENPTFPRNFGVLRFRVLSHTALQYFGLRCLENLYGNSYGSVSKKLWSTPHWSILTHNLTVLRTGVARKYLQHLTLESLTYSFIVMSRRSNPRNFIVLCAGILSPSLPVSLPGRLENIYSISYWRNFTCSVTLMF